MTCWTKGEKCRPRSLWWSCVIRPSLCKQSTRVSFIEKKPCKFWILLKQREGVWITCMMTILSKSNSSGSGE